MNLQDFYYRNFHTAVATTGSDSATNSAANWIFIGAERMHSIGTEKKTLLGCLRSRSIFLLAPTWPSLDEIDCFSVNSSWWSENQKITINRRSFRNNSGGRKIWNNLLNLHVTCRIQETRAGEVIGNQGGFSIVQPHTYPHRTGFVSMESRSRGFAQVVDAFNAGTEIISPSLPWLPG